MAVVSFLQSHYLYKWLVLPRVLVSPSKGLQCLATVLPVLDRILSPDRPVGLFCLKVCYNGSWFVLGFQFQMLILSFFNRSEPKTTSAEEDDDDDEILPVSGRKRKQVDPLQDSDDENADAEADADEQR